MQVMTWIVLFIGLFALVTWVLPVCTDWSFTKRITSLRKVRRLQTQNDLMSFWLEAADETNAEIWGWLKKANARRKRMERALSRQLDKNIELNKLLFKTGWDLGTQIIENAKLRTENEKLQNRNRHLAGELVNDILLTEDRNTVT